MGATVTTERAPDGPDQAPVVSLRDAAKAYGPIQALHGVTLELRAGEVMCLAGENGAGKSTLIKILTGAIRRDDGEYLIDGEDVGNPSPAEAREAGIGVVYQELSLLPDLSVGENLLMGHLPAAPRDHPPGASCAARRRRCSSASASTGSTRTPRSATLSLATQQLVEIAKVLGASPRVLIFDEPTTALSESETKALLARIHQLRDEGHAVMYVTHHLEEMFEIGDRVTILRDGGLVTSKPMSDFDQDSLIASMVGRKIESLYPAIEPHDRRAAPARSAGLRPAGAVGADRLRGARRRDRRHRRPARLRPQRAAARDLRRRPGRGAATSRSTASGCAPATPRRAVQAGLGLLTEDRKQLGLLLELSIRENASLAHLDEISRFWIVDTQARARHRRPVPRRAEAARGLAGSSRCRRCRAATSRRCCSPAGWRRRRRS